MPRLDFEEVLPRFSINGSVQLVEGPSTAEWPEDRLETDLIQLDQPWTVWFRFRTRGDLCEVLCGRWKCCVILEEMGAGESSLPNPCAEIEFNGGPDFYVTSVQVPPRSIREGVYRVIATLRLYGPSRHGRSGRPGPVAAFVDLGLVQFYED
jgi:hypothetical protein